MFVQYFNITRFIDASESFQWDVMNRAMRVRNVLCRDSGAGQRKAEPNGTALNVETENAESYLTF